jgi:hypothetical protein
MSILDPDNKLTSLRVDEDGRLLVTGTGGGGGGVSEGDVEDLIAESRERIRITTNSALTDAHVGRIVEVDYGITVTVPAGLADGEIRMLVPPGGFMTVHPDTGVSVNGLEDDIVVNSASASVVVLARQGDAVVDTFLLDADAGPGFSQRRTYAGPTALTDNDNNTVIEADNVSVSPDYTALFQCVVLLPDGDDLTIVPGGGATLNGSGSTITRLWADGNRMVAIIQRHEDPTDFVVSGV